MTKVFKISDFTTMPGGRFIVTGDRSAEEYYQKFLVPYFKEHPKSSIMIDFSGTWGYGPSFTSQLGIYLKEHYGGYKKTLEKVQLVAVDDPTVINQFLEQLKENEK